MRKNGQDQQDVQDEKQSSHFPGSASYILLILFILSTQGSAFFALNASSTFPAICPNIPYPEFTNR
jgi:hypothetical protein